MGRKTFTVASAVSLVLFSGTVAAWVAGCASRYPVEVRRIGFDYSPDAGGNAWAWHAGTYRGGVYLELHQTELRLRKDPFLERLFRRLAGTRQWRAGEVENASDQPLITTTPDLRCSPPQDGDLLAPDWKTLGFRAYRFSQFGASGFVVLLPCVAILSITAVAPALWLWRHIKESRRQLQGRCPQCGYDLRASSDRCPECGAAVVRSAPESPAGA